VSRSKKLWLSCVIGFLILIIGSVAIIIGTQSGTQWLLGMARPYLPGELVLGDTHGTLLGGLKVDRVEWRSEAALVAAESIELDIELMPLFKRHVAINEFNVGKVDVHIVETGSPESTDDSFAVPEIDLPVEVSIAKGAIKNASVSSGEIERRVDAIDISAALKGAVLTVDSLVVRSDWLHLEISGRTRLQNRIPSDLRAKWRWTPADSPHLAGDIGIKGDLRGYEVRHELSEPVSIITTGSVRVEAGEWFADLKNQWRQLSWTVADRLVRTTGGTLSVRGNDAGFAVELDTHAQLDEFPESRFVMEGDATLDGMRVSELTVVNELAEASIRGDVRWLPSPSMEIELGISGGDINGNPLNGRAQIEYAGDTLLIRDGDVQVGSNRITGSASINDNLMIDVRLALPKPAELLAGVTGSLAGTVFIDGPLNQPNARVELTGSDLAWRDYSVESADISVSGLMQQHDLRATLRSRGRTAQVNADGGYAETGWAGHIGSVAVAGTALGDWQTRRPSALTASNAEINLSELCLFGPSGDESACASAEYVVDGPAVFATSISEFPLKALPLDLPEDMELDGSINIRGNGKLEDERLSGVATVELSDARATATVDGETVSVSLAEAIAQASVTENKLDLTTRLRLEDGTGDGNLQLTIGNVADTDSAIGGNAMVSVSDAAAFAVFLPSITDLHGKIDGSLAISGTPRKPQFVGEIAVREGKFGVRRAGVEISDIEVRLRQLDAGRLQLVGSARSGEGQVTFEGSTQVSAETGIRSEVSLSGNNFELLRLPDWQVAASPEISVVFDERSARVSGELGIPTAIINVKSVPESAESSSPDTTVHRAEGADPRSGRRIDIDVETVLGDNVKLTGFGLTTGIDGAVNLKGGTNAPFTGFGRLSLREGRYKAYGQDLEIDRGELIFNGPLDNPALNIRAVRKIQDVTAGIQLTGTASELQSEVFSEPHLGDAEALSYLLTGRPLASVSTSEEGAALNNAAFALGLSQAGSVVSQIRGQLGLETLTVEGGADSGRIIAGKRIGSRLLVEYGYGLVDKLGTLLLRYQLTDRFVLESRTGTVSNFDIVYSVKKR